MKKLHREILLSACLSPVVRLPRRCRKADPENKLLAVFPRKRLEAEQIRDSLLVAAGKLEDKVGGPSVFPPLPCQSNRRQQFQRRSVWKMSKDPQDHNRRSLYIFTRRSVPYPLLETFDMANPPSRYTANAT